MTSGAVNLTTAPRDADKLQVIGPFMLKRLMEEATKKLTGEALGEERKQAFLRDPIDKRAKDVLEMLQQIDKAGGGAPAPAAEPAASTTPATEEKAAAKPKRDPKPASAVNGAATNGASVVSDNNGQEVLNGIAGVLKGVSESMAAMQGTLQQVEKGGKRLEALEQTMEQMFKLQHLTMGVLLQMAEQSLGAPSADILEQVASDYSSAEAVVTKLIAGK